MTQSVTRGPGHKMHSIRAGYCSVNLVPAVANIRDHLVSVPIRSEADKLFLKTLPGEADPVFVKLLTTIFCRGFQRKY